LETVAATDFFTVEVATLGRRAAHTDIMPRHEVA